MPRTGRRVAVVAVAALGMAGGETGPVCAQPLVSIFPSIGVTETYSDNVDRLPGGSRDGFTTHVTPRIRVALGRGRLTGAGGYGLGLRIEHFSGGQTEFDHDAQVALGYEITPRWHLSLRDDFRYGPDPTQSLAFATPEGRLFRTFEEAARTPGVDVLDLRAIGVREDELRNRLEIGTHYDLTPRLRAGGEAVWTVDDPKVGVFREGSESLELRAPVRYRLTPIDDVIVAARYETVDFERSPDVDILRGELGWDRELTPTTRLGLRGGYAVIDSKDGGGGSEHEYYLRGTLAGRVAEGRWRLTLAHDIGTSEGLGDVTERNSVFGMLSRELGRLLSARAELGYLQSRSIRGFSEDVDTLETTLGATYRFIRWASARAAYRFRRDEPAGGGADTTENQVLVGVEVLWPLREVVGLGATGF
jgi:hypothetical protein